MCLPGTVETVRGQIEREGAPRVDRRTLLAGGAAAALAAALPVGAAAGRPAKKRFRDLTHTFREGFPVFVTGEEPQRETIANYATDGFYAQRWTLGEHSGTHMDAPGHFVPGGRLSPEITPRELLVPIVVTYVDGAARPLGVIAYVATMLAVWGAFAIALALTLRAIARARPEAAGTHRAAAGDPA